jgi:AcrR family transcriptional regulator
MKAVHSTRAHANARGRRDGGANTRSQILEAAGEVFAEKGFDRATGKEIADRAGTNSAAVNYYFGGIAGLYEEVLVAAHQRLVSYEALTAIATTTAGAPEAKLRGFIELVVGALASPLSTTWAFRVLSREILSPSPFIEALKVRQLQPKKLLLSTIVADVMGLPQDHPLVDTGCYSVLAPCAMLLVADRRLITQMFPALAQAADKPKPLVDHLVRFALAGLEALAADEQAVSPRKEGQRGRL